MRKIGLLVFIIGCLNSYSFGFGVGVGAKLEYSDALLEEESGFAVLPHLELLLPANLSLWLGYSQKNLEGDSLVTKEEERWVAETVWYLMSPVVGPYLKAGFENTALLRDDELGDVEYNFWTLGGGALLSAGELSSIGFFADYAFSFDRRQSGSVQSQNVSLNKLRFGLNFKLLIPL
jgi:hypothetical protein